MSTSFGTIEIENWPYICCNGARVLLSKCLCGSKSILYVADSTNESFVKCSNCSFCSKIFQGKNSDLEAATAWNDEIKKIGLENNKVHFSGEFQGNVLLK